jgi:hypothetical protein
VKSPDQAHFVAGGFTAPRCTAWVSVRSQLSRSIDGFVRATDRGLEYLQQFIVPASVLNEDQDGTNEVFVRGRFVDGDCGSRVQNTNVVKGNL